MGSAGNLPLGTLSAARVLVLGDVMLDRYLHGTMGRISPEAPVPIVSLYHESFVLGGAGNVAASVAALGGQVTLSAMIGRDADGEMVRSLVASAGVNHDELSAHPDLPTISKTRVVAGKYQQVLRIDRDTNPAALAAEAIRRLPRVLELVAEHDVVVLADYEKGNLPAGLIEAVIASCRQQGKLCLVDPKKADFSVYRGATLLAPNVLEASRALDRPLDSESEVAAAASRLRELLQLDYMVITCGANGMVVARAEGTAHVPAEVREVADVTGAGDTVTSVLALALASKWDVVDACRLASIAAGIAVSKPRTYVVQAYELARAAQGESVKILDRDAAARAVAEAQRLGHTVVFTNGCFDVLHAGHLSCLERARKLGDLLVLGLNSDRSVRFNKGPQRPVLSAMHRASLLAGLACVDIVVVFDEDTPEELLRRLLPDVLVKGDDREARDIVGADIVTRRGGRVVTLPIIQGLSTSAILHQVRTAAPAEPPGVALPLPEPGAEVDDSPG